MDTEKKFKKRRSRSVASAYGAQYDQWKTQYTSQVDDRIQAIQKEKNSVNKRKFCREFNNWVDDTKENFMGDLVISLNVEGDPDQAWNEIENYIKGKINPTYVFSNSCSRIPSKYSKEKRDKRKVIIDFCEERDTQFQALKRNPQNDKCLTYNNWIDQYKSNFTSTHAWSLVDSMGQDQDFKISNNCTLINMNMFSKEDCASYNKNLTSRQKGSSAQSMASTQKKPSKTTTSISMPPITTTTLVSKYTPAPTLTTPTTTTSTTQPTTIPTSTTSISTTSHAFAQSTTASPTTTSSQTATPTSATVPASTQPSTPSPITTPSKITIPLPPNTPSTTTSSQSTTPSTTPSTTSPQPTTSSVITSSQITTSPQPTTPSNTTPSQTTTSTTTPTTTFAQPIAPLQATTSTPTNTSLITPITASTSANTTAHPLAPTNISTIVHSSATTSISMSTPISTSTPIPTHVRATTPIPVNISSDTSATTSKPTTASTPIATSKPVTKTISNNTTYNSNVALTNFTTTTYTKNNALSNTSNISSTPSSLAKGANSANISSNSIKSTSTGISFNIIPLSLGLGGTFLGIIFFLILAFKYTPIGSWIDNRRSKKKTRKEQKIQVDRVPTFSGFPDEKSEGNMKSIAICNKMNSSLSEIAFENEVKIKKIHKREYKEDENNEKREKVKEYNSKNIETKSNIAVMGKKWKWKTVIEIHMIVLEDCKKEEWELNRGEFLEICLEEFKKEEGIYSDIINRDVLMERKQEESISAILEEQKRLWKRWTERHEKMLEKWKKEEWFKNLKKEWKKEENKYAEIEGVEIIKDTKKREINPILERQKIIWKKWIEKQRKWLHKLDNEEWLKELLEEYETEEVKRNMDIIDREKITEIGKKNEADKDSKENKLIPKLWIEIHMIVLEDYKKEEWTSNKKEFFKTCIEELKIQENSDEKEEILEIEGEIMENLILEKKKEELEKLRREKWFIELKQEWMSKEKKYMKALNKENLSENNGEIIENPMLQKQRAIWKKHWKEIHKKWLEDENKKECFMKLKDEFKTKEVDRKEVDKINIIKKYIKEDEIEREREDEADIQKEKKEEINEKDEKGRKKKEKKIKNTEGKVGEKKKSNYITLRKKPKWKTMIEIHMMIIEDCKQEEWELNRGEFLEICLNEWLKDEGSVEDIIDKEIILKGEKESVNIALEKQRLLSKKWIERQRKMLEKWKKEEWFRNLKEEWKKKENIYTEAIDKVETMDKRDEIKGNPTLERKKEIWRQWLEKQKEEFMEYDKEPWFKKLLEEYEKEENEEGIEEKKKNLEKERREVEIIDIKEEEDKKIRKKNLISNMWIEIHMTILDQCKKEELESMRNEFLKSYIEQKKEYEGLYKQEMGNKEVDEVEKEREMNIMIEKKKKQWECWKKENWFQELKSDWKEEMKHMKEITNSNSEITDDIKEEAINPILEIKKIEKQWQEKHRNILRKRNKQNKLEKSIEKKKKDEEKIEDENDDNSEDWDVTIL